MLTVQLSDDTCAGDSARWVNRQRSYSKLGRIAQNQSPSRVPSALLWADTKLLLVP
jgi:hypothetical protein